MQIQTEKAITAWQEVAQTTLKEKIEDQLRTQTEKIEDFTTNHEQQLMSLLDGYEEHARGIQAKLLSHLHMETKQKYKEAQSEERQQDAIPMDEDEGPISDGDNASPSVNPAGDDNAYPHVRASRWKTNVDREEILAGHSTVTRGTPLPHAPSQDDNTLPAVSSNREDTGTTDVSATTPKYPAADYHQLARLRTANTPNQLRGQDRKAVCIFYNSFVDFNRIDRIPLKILDDIRLDRLDQEEETLYLSGLDNNPQLYDDYSSAVCLCPIGGRRRT